MIFPKRPNPEDKLSADWGRQVVDCLRALQFLGGPGLITKQSPNGSTAAVVRQTSKGSAVASPDPTEWDVSISGSTASVLPRPIVFADRTIPAGWEMDEVSAYSDDIWSALHPPLTINLLDDEGVGLGSGFVYAEIDLDKDALADEAIILGFSVIRPVDDPANSLVRIPLAHVSQTTTTVEEVTTYTFEIDAWLHRGSIHIPALFAP